MNPQEANQWMVRKMKQFNLTSKFATILYERKWNMGYFNGTRFSIHPVHLDEEITTSYGSKKYIPQGTITIKAHITDDEESLYIPCIYKIGNVNVIEGPLLKDIREIVSYEGLYCSIGKRNEQIK